MSSTFSGFEIGRRALSASQLALNVTGQNTANVGTAGYSRQVAVLEETDPYGGVGVDSGRAGQLGTGVSVASINRVRDEYLDKRIYGANSEQGALDSLRDTLTRVETAYGEPSATGVGSRITTFFNAFSDLASSPESGAVRSTVLSKAQSLVSAFHTVSGALSTIAPELKSRISAAVSDANDIAAQIATLNKQIGANVQDGQHPNDLLDKRTALIGKLSSLVDVRVLDGRNSETNQPNGLVQINVGGYTLVQGDTASSLPSNFTNINSQPALQTANGDAIPLKGGAISGLIQANGLVDGYSADLDTLASNVISAVNTRHAAGAGLDGVRGRNFLTGTGAGDIALDPEVAGKPDNIAAASAPAPGATVAAGNGQNARSLAALVSQPLIGQSSLNQYYNAKVAAIGADSQRFLAQADTQSKVVAQLQNQQSSVSGVNLDEELTKLLQFQRAYQAAARIINIQDDVIDRIINGLGVGK